MKRKYKYKVDIKKNKETIKKIVKKREQNQVLALAYVLIWFAKNESGDNIFTIEDNRALQFKVDPDVLARVATEILSDPDAEEVKKN